MHGIEPGCSNGDVSNVRTVLSELLSLLTEGLGMRVLSEPSCLYFFVFVAELDFPSLTEPKFNLFALSYVC